MTENEAKQWLKHTRAYQHKCDNCEYIDIKGACNEECKDFYDMAIKALEEIQQYRAIGTIDEFKAFRSDDFTQDLLDIGYTKGMKDGYNKVIDEFTEKITFEISDSIIWDMIITMNKNSSISDTSDKIVDYVIETINKIAEQMKGGE